MSLSWLDHSRSNPSVRPVSDSVYTLNSSTFPILTHCCDLNSQHLDFLTAASSLVSSLQS